LEDNKERNNEMSVEVQTSAMCDECGKPITCDHCGNSLPFDWLYSDLLCRDCEAAHPTLTLEQKEADVAAAAQRRRELLARRTPDQVLADTAASALGGLDEMPHDLHSLHHQLLMLGSYMSVKEENRILDAQDELWIGRRILARLNRKKQLRSEQIRTLLAAANAAELLASGDVRVAVRVAAATLPVQGLDLDNPWVDELLEQRAKGE
jgi:hypothetical protein